MDAESPFALFALPPRSVLLAEAEGRTERGYFRINCRGSVIQGRDGPIGANMGLDLRQRTYWLPYDYPDFDTVLDRMHRASMLDEQLDLTLDPVRHVILEVHRPAE